MADTIFNKPVNEEIKELSEQIGNVTTRINSTIASSWFVKSDNCASINDSYTFCAKSGDVVTVQLSFTSASTITGGNPRKVGTLAAKYRPKIVLFPIFYDNNSASFVQGYISTNGTVGIYDLKASHSLDSDAITFVCQ